MKSIEASGRSKEEAIEKALAELNLPRSQVSVKVIQEGSKGFLGLGGRHLKVRVSELGENEVDPGGVVNTLLGMMGVKFEISSTQDEECTNIRIDSPEDEGLLIGRRGQTLDAIRHLTQRIVAAKVGRNMVVNIDIGDYRERREESLRERAEDAATKVVEAGKSYTLDPMSAQDRRLVHLCLADRDDLHTFTVGKGTRRCVVVAPGAAGSREPREQRESRGPIEQREQRESRDQHTPRESRGERKQRTPRGEREQEAPREQRIPREPQSPREDEMAYDRVPDPGFRSAPLSSLDTSNHSHWETEVHESFEKERRVDEESRQGNGRRSSQQRRGPRSDAQQDGNRWPDQSAANEVDGNVVPREGGRNEERGERRDDSSRRRRRGGRGRGRGRGGDSRRSDATQEKSGDSAIPPNEMTVNDQGDVRGSKQHDESASTQGSLRVNEPVQDTGPAAGSESSDNRHDRMEDRSEGDRDGNRGRRDDRPQRERSSKGRDRDRSRRDHDRHQDSRGSDRDRDGGNGGSHEPATLTKIERIGDDSSSKPFTNELAKRILQLGSKDGKKTVASRNKRRR